MNPASCTTPVLRPTRNRLPNPWSGHGLPLPQNDRINSATLTTQRVPAIARTTYPLRGNPARAMTARSTATVSIWGSTCGDRPTRHHADSAGHPQRFLYLPLMNSAASSIPLKRTSEPLLLRTILPSGSITAQVPSGSS
jgi:hypothetical protein